MSGAIPFTNTPDLPNILTILVFSSLLIRICALIRETRAINAQRMKRVLGRFTCVCAFALLCGTH
jgi:hypothetical protein